MDAYYTRRIAVLALVCAIGFTGYAFMSVGAFDSPDYDLVIDNIPCNFDLNKTLYIDTQTNDRGFVIYNDHLDIRSQYLTFYELNDSYEHDDINLVIGSYCYAYVPARNATLDTITEINRFQLSSWNGTVTVQRPTDYSTTRMVLTVNSTDNATLLIRAVGLHRNYEYRVFVDGHPEAWLRVNSAQYIEYNYTGDWSTHTITFQLSGQATEVPALYLGLAQVMLCMGLFVVVIKSMIWPLKDPSKRVSSEQMTKTVIKAMIYIVIGLFMIVLTFKLFVGV